MLFASKDILNITLSISIGILTVFLIIFLYYVIASIRRVNKILKEVMSFTKVFWAIKEKLEHSTSHLGFIAEAVKRIVMHFIEGKLEIKTKKKRGSKRGS